MGTKLTVKSTRTPDLDQSVSSFGYCEQCHVCSLSVSSETQKSAPLIGHCRLIAMSPWVRGRVRLPSLACMTHLRLRLFQQR